MLKESKNLDFNVKHVVDPVLLLNNKQWLEVIPKQKIKDKYIYCYFLGKEKKFRELAVQYAKIKKIKIVQIPFLNGFNEYDNQYGDIKINIAGPLDFISLIKYSECVFTDSFHATILSIHFNRNFFVFPRNVQNSMSSRITSILNYINYNSNFCNTIEKININYLLKLKNIDYNEINDKMNQWIEDSKQLLLQTIKE